ncbi:MAG TPA: hypothetical protein VM307_12085 [Egibacteraceae bacterium]|nr:hypothetical protein [Egibacteraceae bacterium]
MSTPTVTRQTSPPPAPAPHPSRPDPAGRMVLGGLLILLGVAWLLEATGAFALRWQALLSGALIVIGGVMIATARRGHHGGLGFLGVVLALLLIVSSLIPTRLPTPLAGVGERTYQPTTVAELAASYELAAGPLAVDLSGLRLEPGQQAEVTAGVGAGELTVTLPPDATVEVKASTAAGEVNIAGRTRNGVGVRVDEIVHGGEMGGRLVLDLSVGFGSIEVRR